MATKKTVTKKTSRATKKAPVQTISAKKVSAQKSGLFDYFRFGESYTSLILGMVVVIIATILLVAFFKNRNITEVNPKQDISATSISPESLDRNIYIVKEGDTLWSIAENRYNSGYNWVDILEANKNIKDPANLEKGTRLVLPNVDAKQKTLIASEKKDATPTPTQMPSPTPTTAKATPSVAPTGTQQNQSEANPNLSPHTDRIVGTSYTVREGDYLWEIAERAYGDGYKWVEIARKNSILNPDVIHKGNVLQLPR